MGGEGPAARALSRIDAEVARFVAGRDRVVLAFSGGLGSLLVAALARKRCDLRSAVVGFRGSADVEAALVARWFLDYPLAVQHPTPGHAAHVGREIWASNPRLNLTEVLSLVPLALVEERDPHGRVLSGFGLTARGPALREALRLRTSSCPGLRCRFSRSTRIPLLRMAEVAGLPDSFARAAPRTPSEGSGVGPALRALSRSRGISVARLLASDVRAGDNHERSATRAEPQSSEADYHV